MSRIPTSLLCALLGLSLVGCKDAKKLVEESKEGYEVIKEIAANVADLSASVSTNDFAKAKEISAKADQLLKTRVLSWCVQILVTEEKEGVAAAMASVENLKSTEAITSDELAALGEIENYFKRKGSERTGDLVVLLGALVTEQKFGHGAGGLLLRTRETYRTPQLQADTPSTNGTAK